MFRKVRGVTNEDREPLTGNEQRILQLIKKDPYVSQQELAEVMGLSRPSVANIISGLVRKNFILGKAYILNESEPIVCIGGANIDRKYYVKDSLQWSTSNPVTSTDSVGGVARNIAENLGRLDMETILLTAGGTDAAWTHIKESSSLYMNVSYAALIPEMTTGSYSAILDADGEMIFALADMDVYEAITPQYILKHDRLLSRAKCVAADLNCPKETLQLLCHKANQYNLPLMLVTVSAPKMTHLPEDLNDVTWLITNREESEASLDRKITDNEEWRKAVTRWLEKGVSNAVITDGGKGAMIGNEEAGIYHVPAVPMENAVDVTGAGDAFCSAVLYAWLEGKDLPAIAKAGMINAAETLTSAYTVRENLSAAQLQKEMEERS
ncbi:carbohydrate kinase [Salibacterium aidingense]|uniref:carbohydrate kinase n=1 Tax=Salibacterium aidingense TaxID=384933 RepID=UPI003BE16EF4